MNILFKRESSKNFKSTVKDFKKEVDINLDSGVFLPFDILPAH